MAGEERDLGRLAGSVETLANSVEGVWREVREVRKITEANGQRISSLETKCESISTQINEIKRTKTAPAILFIFRPPKSNIVL